MGQLTNATTPRLSHGTKLPAVQGWSREVIKERESWEHLMQLKANAPPAVREEEVQDRELG